MSFHNKNNVSKGKRNKKHHEKVIGNGKKKQEFWSIPLKKKKNTMIFEAQKATKLMM